MQFQSFPKFYRQAWFQTPLGRCTFWAILPLFYYFLCSTCHHAAEVKSVGQAESRKPAQPHPQIATSSSCSGRACHGGSEPVPGQVVGQNEYSSWLAKDPHVRAYDALLSERGKSIAKNLGGPEAHKDIRCLACHVTPQLAMAQAKSNDPLDLGVGCESCHGSASKKWLSEHTTAGWKKLANHDKQKAYDGSGMNYLSNPVIQSQVCTGCHIGAPADEERGIPLRDANHDIMAAGHPRLIFESTTFADNLPPHWNVAKYSQDPDRKGLLWACGQVVVAWASARLAEMRSSEKMPVWPEFAQSDCFSCHADFSNPSWRRSSGYYSKRKAGSIPVNAWPFALLEDSLALLGKKDPALVALISDYRSHSESSSASRQQVHFASEKLASKLAGLVNLFRESTPALSKNWQADWKANLDKKWTPNVFWDQAVQMGMAYGVLESSRLPLEFWPHLSFPPGYESPKGYKVPQ